MMKEKEMKRVPKLRFPEFTDDWEQRKLGELIKNISTGKSVNSNDELVSGEDIAVLKTSCVSNDRFDSTECKRVIEGEVEFVKCPIKKDNVIVSRMNTPERVGACGYIAENHDNLFLPDRLWQLKFKEEVSAYYIYTMLISTAYKNEIRSMASGTSSSMYNIPQDRFLNLHMRITPSKAEQEAIGRYFSQLDHLITLHQRKLKNLNVLKKCVMQKLFSQKVRFKADDGSEFPKWKEKRLGDVFTERTERSKGGETLLSVTIAQGIVRQSETDKRNTASENKSNYKIVKRNDLAYNTMRMWQGAEGVSEYDGIVSPAYTVITALDGNNSYFFEILFKQTFMLQIFQRYSQGLTSDTWNLKFPTFSEIKCLVPCEDEQNKIVECVTVLDSVIEKQKATLAAWEELKKGLLQQMFV